MLSNEVNTYLSSLFFMLPDQLGMVELVPHVLMHFEAHKQHKWRSREAGGQLFATTNGDDITRIADVTGPRPTDKRSMFGYIPDRCAERIEIAERYSQGLHFIGDWHTHRQLYPTPSSTDESSMRDLVTSSRHDLPGFIMVVVGQAAFPKGIHVSFHTKELSCSLVATECVQ